METTTAPTGNLTGQQLTQVAQALNLLRKSNSLHMSGNPEAAIDLEREARLILVALLQGSEIETINTTNPERTTA